MGHYTHLTFKERKKLYVYLQMDLKVKEIAKRMRRYRSTIYRELKRNKEENIIHPV